MGGGSGYFRGKAIKKAERRMMKKTGAQRLEGNENELEMDRNRMYVEPKARDFDRKENTN